MSFTQPSMFEALFERRLKPTGAFAAALADAGYVPGALVHRYPTEVWTRCLELAREHVWPTLEPTEAYRRLGRAFSEGFLETSAGRLLEEALPYMPVESFLSRLESYFRLGRQDVELAFDVVERGPKFARVVVHNPSGVPGAFVAGLIDVAFARMGQPGAVGVIQTTPTDYELEIRW